MNINWRGIHLVIVAIVVTLGFFTYTIWQVLALVHENESNREIKQVFLQKQIDSLIKEVDDLKQTDIVLTTTVTEQKVAQKLTNAKTQLDQLNAQLQITKLVGASAVAVASWKGRVAQISCNFGNVTQSGSGTLFAGPTGPLVLTNKHVAESEDGRTPTSCTINFPDINEKYIVMSGSNLRFSGTLDLAVLVLPNASQKVNTIIGKQTFCGIKTEIGTRMLVMGYPVIGTSGAVTVTEGIISGYDGSYYTTSAKVERGHSGGATIAIDNNCFLGVPTFVEFGSLESLARILDVRGI